MLEAPEVAQPGRYGSSTGLTGMQAPFSSLFGCTWDVVLLLRAKKLLKLWPYVS